MLALENPSPLLTLMPPRCTDAPVVATCTTIESVLAEMTRRWHRLHRAGDWREVFAQTYLRATERILLAVQQGKFENTAWMVRLDCLFAQFYFNAFDGWEATRSAPLAWKVAFQNTHGKRTLVFQDVLLGMNAHINNDLPYALEMTIPADATPDELASYHRDHRTLDVILAEAIDVIQATADDLDPSLTLADGLLGRHDEKAFAQVVALWRSQAWAYFLLLRGGHDRAQVAYMIENSAYLGAHLVLQFQHVLPLARWPNRIYRDSVSWCYRHIRR